MPRFGFGRPKAPKVEPSEHSASDVYLDMRRMALDFDANVIGAHPSADMPHVWAVIVDWGVGAGSATFVALADGTSSMYTSSGGGIVGAGGHENVRAANRALLLAAEAAYDHLAPVGVAALPDPKRITYWVRTYNGMRMASHPNDAARREPWLNALGDAFQNFVGAMRIAEGLPRP